MKQSRKINNVFGNFNVKIDINIQRKDENLNKIKKHDAQIIKSKIGIEK